MHDQYRPHPMHSARQYTHYSCSAFKGDSFIIVKVSLCYWKGYHGLIGMSWVIVFDKNSLHCWFLQMRNLSPPNLFPVLPDQVIYLQPNKIMAYLTFHKWLVLVCNIHNDTSMAQTKTSHKGKVSYAIILLGWQYGGLVTQKMWWVQYFSSFFLLWCTAPQSPIHIYVLLKFEPFVVSVYLIISWNQ